MTSIPLAGITVDTLSDADDGTDGRCSLREAILAANTNADYNECTRSGPGPDDTITFSVSGVIVLNNGMLPTIPASASSGALTIEGGERITISGNDSTRLLQVSPNGALTLRELHLTAGYVAAGDGGALFNEGGNVQIENCTFSNNRVDDGFGGAISNRGGQIIINGSRFLNNRIEFTGEGGAIFNTGGQIIVSMSLFSKNVAEGGGAIAQLGPLDPSRLTISDTTFSNNRATFGGALDVDRGEAFILRSTFSENAAFGGYGGALAVFGTVTAINTTFSANRLVGGFGGGAILNGGTIHLSFVTITLNSADAGGGGIRNTGAGTALIKNSIVAGNPSGGDCVGAVVSLGGNVDSDGSCFGAGSPNINLGPLQDNGGPTWTHALQVGSAALDIADCRDVFGNPISEDQRGVARPQPAAGMCDAGAFEARRFTLTVSRTGTGTGTVTSTPAGISCAPDCSEDYPEGTLVTLTATPAPGSVFVGWGGACSGTTPSTLVTLNGNKTCTARFEPLQADLRINKRASLSLIPVGHSLLYTIEVANRGPSDAIAGVVDQLPEDAQLESVSGGWSCTVLGTEVTCTRFLPAGTMAPPIRVSVQAPFVSSILVNTVRVSSGLPDPQPKDNATRVETVVAAPGLALFAARSSPGPTTAGQVAPLEESTQGALVADPFQDRVRVFLNRGDGRFERKQDIRVGRGPVMVAVGDLTGDGWTDAVTADWIGESMTVIRGRGDGTFEPKGRTFLVNGRPRAVALGDFNRDGHLDVVVAYWEQDQVQVFSGRGDGTFVAGRQHAVGKRPSALAVADVDQDGWLDILVANFGSQSVTVLQGREDGTFSNGGEVATGEGPVAVVPVDVDGDGHLEVITANHRGSSLSLVRLKAGGSHAVRFEMMATALTGEGPLSVVARRSGMNEPMVFAASAIAREIRSYRFDGRLTVIQRLSTTVTPTALVAGDFNGDGRTDIMTLDASGQTLEVWITDARGMLRKRP